MRGAVLGQGCRVISGIADSGKVTSNAVQGSFSQLKRSIDGTYHHISARHLPLYLAEFDFRYSSRKLSDTARTEKLLGQVAGRRLTYLPLKNPA